MTRRTNALRQVAMLAGLVIMMTACWSSDTMFITLTATPLPTPTTPARTIESLYRVGDRVQIVSVGIGVVYLTQQPEPPTRRNRVPNAACYPNTNVTILDVEAVEGVTYYRVACNNTPGWVVENSLGEPGG